MGKRSEFTRRSADAYDTPAKGVEPLIPHLPTRPFYYVEPCAGRGALIDAMPMWAKAVVACDTEPRGGDVVSGDAMSLTKKDVQGVEFIITNPPWTRAILHPMIDHFRGLRPTWLLFDADWAFTKQAAPFMKHCAKFVAVGRLRWIPDSPYDGKDNAGWYLFLDHPVQTQFFGRLKE